MKKTHQYALLATTVFIVAFSMFSLVGGMQQLPSPIYGGDYYHQKGCIESIRASLNPFTACNINGALPSYLPLYGALIALISLITFQPVFTAMISGSILIAAAGTVLYYYMFREYFQEQVALLLLIPYAFFATTMTFKYTEFTVFIMMPLFFWMLGRYITDRSWNNALLLGAVWGLLGLSHAIAFIATSLVMALYFGYEGISWLLRKRTFKSSAILTLLAVLVIGIIIALPYWYRPLFVHHGQTSLHYTEWNTGNTQMDLAGYFTFSYNLLKGSLLVSTPYFLLRMLFLLLLILGLVVLCFSKAKQHTLTALTIICFIVLFHFVLTLPLLNFTFAPGYVSYFLTVPLRLLIMGVGLAYLYKRIPHAAYGLYAVPVIVAIILLVSRGGVAQEQFYKNAFTAPNPIDAAAEAYIREHTHHEDTFLTTNELSFKLNALTGRKAVASRRAHNDAFLDMDVRNRDAAIMLYGNDSAKTAELLKAYGVDYVYWDYFWIQSEFQFDNNGNLVNIYDPLLTFSELNYGPEYRKYGIVYFNHTFWVDPALRDPTIKQFPLDVIAPNNYRSQTEPWHESLHQYLVPVWNFTYEGEMYAAIYKVEVPQ